MTKLSALKMTVILASVFAAFGVLADIINQENLKTHLRWNMQVPRDQVYVVKKDQMLLIESVNLELFDQLTADLLKIKKANQYIESIKYSKENFPATPATISVQLKDPSVELFSFYREADRKYILDFWINTDLVSEKTAALKKSLEPLPDVPKLQKKPASKKIIAEVKKADVPVVNPKEDVLTRKSPLLPVLEVVAPVANLEKTNPEYRDIRYGASFFWDYPQMIPSLEKDINLASKTPEAFYPIKDRVNLDDAKEAHMQLTINFYREEKWGLMNKSITLYQQKYGRDSNYVLNEFIKANALLKGNLAKPNRGITQSAMVMLSNLKDLTDDYELKSSILRYLIQYSVEVKDHVRSLELSKQLFVESRAQFDHTMVIQAALTILHSLGELKQVDKIHEFLSDKKLASILPPQMEMAYTSFAMLAKGESKEIIAKFKSIEKSLARPIHPAILYNVAESYFRHAEYDAAIKIYDEFLATYSYLLQAPYARLRLALAYEILDRPADQNIVLYKNAIDRSTSSEIRYEAKLRYVAYKLTRKINPTDEDREAEVFMEQSPDEKKAIGPDLRKLLWLVRLRLFITSKEYDKALSYLTSIQLDALKPSERRVFEGDGAEIVFGLIQEAYMKEDYAKVVKLWEIYKDKYETKVAKNLYMNFVACEAFIKLGLFKSYDRALASFKKISGEETRTFPIWINRVKSTNLDQMTEELNLIRLIAEADYKGASSILANYPVSLRDSINYPYYEGVVHFHQKQYKDAVINFEKVLVRQNPKNQLTPRQTADLLMGYVESLYQLNDQNQFKTIVQALIKDINNSKSAPILNIAERINYLLIETYVGDSAPEWMEIEMLSKVFREKFQKSPYTSRVSYLYGLSLIKNAKVSEGKEVLTLLTKEKGVPSHIKEMCRSELATIELSKRNY